MNYLHDYESEEVFSHAQSRISISEKEKSFQYVRNVFFADLAAIGQ